MRDISGRLAARCIDAVRIHRTREVTLDGVVGFHKKRRRGMGVLFGPGNLFLRLSKSRIQMFADVAVWQSHEVESFLACHPERKAWSIGRLGIFIEKLPGTTLRDLVRGGQLAPGILRHGATELRRVHSLQNSSGEPWSHGDPHLGNFLFDAVTARCYIIDFETAHLSDCSATERQADDVLTFCLELLGQRHEAVALRDVSIFLESYGCAKIISELCKRLSFPQRLERVLWATRTDYLPAKELELRISCLRKILSGLHS